MPRWQIAAATLIQSGFDRIPLRVSSIQPSASKRTNVWSSDTTAKKKREKKEREQNQLKRSFQLQPVFIFFTFLVMSQIYMWETGGANSFHLSTFPLTQISDTHSYNLPKQHLSHGNMTTCSLLPSEKPPQFGLCTFWRICVHSCKNAGYLEANAHVPITEVAVLNVNQTCTHFEQ